MQKLATLGDFNAITPQGCAKMASLGNYIAINPQSCVKMASLGNYIAITPQSYAKIQVRKELEILHLISFFAKIFRTYPNSICFS